MRINFRGSIGKLVLLATICSRVSAQTTPQKEITQQVQTWFSLNSTFRQTTHWGVMADLHVRRTDFIQDPSFYFVRFGPNYWFKDNMSASAGYAHLWSAPTQADYSTWSNENRIYQQFLFSTKMGKTGILQRVRNEQRWQEVVVGDVKTGSTRFSNRVRYLASFSIPLWANPKKPVLVIAEEFLLQFGKDIVYNSFDQNRLFLGIRQPLNPQWSYDFGYMNVFQQKASGYQYNMNHTLRLFFYFNGGKMKRSPAVHLDHHDE